MKKVPGIGPVFANRIIKYRELLGGFYSVEQLKEVYGIEEDRFSQLKDWFKADALLIRKVYINQLTEEELRSHPYINYKQARAIHKLYK
ncbi:MAG: helix-hairpin-helix domain-containing protein, partial [Tannerellaceae bacterium]|nr:helix-hairpin-helix domain-containing protein [Tannerellaceae bacterium]